MHFFPQSRTRCHFHDWVHIYRSDTSIKLSADCRLGLCASGWLGRRIGRKYRVLIPKPFSTRNHQQCWHSRYNSPLTEELGLNCVCCKARLPLWLSDECFEVKQICNVQLLGSVSFQCHFRATTLLKGEGKQHNQPLHKHITFM